MNIKQNKIFFSQAEIKEIEAKYMGGLTSLEVLEIFDLKEIKLSQATFSKYVQLGLCPRSRRVGSKGRHKGSKGVYPTVVIRQINEIKKLMASDYTIEEIRQIFAFISGDVEEIKELISRIFQKLENSISIDDNNMLGSKAMHRRLEKIKKSAQTVITELEDTASRINELRRLEREAI